ncbi:MAG: GNAT family N-acetyltransferase [Ruminococcus sp.]|nr:GNAT family N-acetyltransferase [Ruminococcus sp.]
MLYLKEANVQDVEEEYAFIKDLPADENGFTNNDCGIEKAEFLNTVLPRMINHSKGIDLPDGFVPGSEFFLWEDDTIVGLFRIRHYLNEFLRNNAGHIGYGIKKEHRGRGLATKGLALAIEKAKEIIREDEIYMSVNCDNLASLEVQKKNGAYIHHSDNEKHYTRIKI